MKKLILALLITISVFAVQAQEGDGDVTFRYSCLNTIFIPAGTPKDSINTIHWVNTRSLIVINLIRNRITVSGPDESINNKIGITEKTPPYSDNVGDRWLVGYGEDENHVRTSIILRFYADHNGDQLGVLSLGTDKGTHFYQLFKDKTYFYKN